MRPAPAAAAVRVCGGAGAALLRVVLPRRALRAYVCTQQRMRMYAYVCAHAQNEFQRRRGRVRARARDGGRR